MTYLIQNKKESSTKETIAANKTGISNLDIR